MSDNPTEIQKRLVDLAKALNVVVSGMIDPRNSDRPYVWIVNQDNYRIVYEVFPENLLEGSKAAIEWMEGQLRNSPRLQ